MSAVPAGGSGLTIRTTLAPGPVPSVASPVMPVSTPSQGPGYSMMAPAPPSTASSSPALQSFLAAMTHPDAAPMAPAAPQPVQQPGAAVAASPRPLLAEGFPQVNPAAPQQTVLVVQAPAQAATPRSAAPAAF